MKSHSKASPQRSLLGGEVLLAVLADQRHPGLGQRAHLLERHVLGRGEDLDPLAGALAHPLEVAPDPRRARGRGSGPARQRSARSRRGRPGARCAVVAAVGEEELRLAARAELADLDPLDPALREQPARDLAQVEHPPLGDPVARARERLQHLVADLVAAGADPGADRRGRRRRPRGRRARRSRPRGRASRSAASPPRPGPTRATGRQSATKTSGARPGSAVAWPSRSGSSGPGSAKGLGLGGESRRSQLGAVDLAPDQDAAGVEPERGREPAAVLGARGAARRRSGSPRLRLSNGAALTPPSGS